ncbi:MAG: LamG-like jellyroll fold domain-containing protein [Deltaproteobacteria bacterium]
MRRCIPFITLALAGCAGDLCESEPTAVEMQVRTNDDRVQSLVVTLGYGGARYRQTFDVAQFIDDGTVTLAINLSGAPSEAFELTADVTGHTASGGGGTQVVEASETMTASADACNIIIVALGDGSVRDGGGVEEDAGVVDGGDRDGGFRDAGPARDGGPRDAGPDGGPRDGGPEPDAGDRDGGDRDGGFDRDGGERDGGFERDGGERDGGVPQPLCPMVADADTVALYTFDGDADDVTGNHDGNAVSMSYAGSIVGCGQALDFGNSGGVNSYVVIDDDPAFDLSEGSIEALIRLNSVTSNRPRFFFSRSSEGNDAGEIRIGVACDGTVVLERETGFSTVRRCSANPVPANQFVHIGVNFGPGGLELYVDGDSSLQFGFVGYRGSNCNDNVNCGGITNGGMAGNNDPLVIGATSEDSSAGTTDDLDDPFRGGRLDALRISSARRNF